MRAHDGKWLLQLWLLLLLLLVLVLMLVLLLPSRRELVVVLLERDGRALVRWGWRREEHR